MQIFPMCGFRKYNERQLRMWLLLNACFGILVRMWLLLNACFEILLRHVFVTQSVISDSKRFYFIKPIIFEFESD